MSSTMTPTAPAPAVSNREPLTALDRCDSCGAQAYIVAEMVAGSGKSLDLMFCGHHYNAHSAALIGQGAVVVVNELWKLDPKNSNKGA